DTPDLSASRLLTYPITEYGYHVTVSNLLPDPLIDASLIVQNLWEYCYSTLPPGFIHPDDIVWNPGAIANGSIPAYDLGIIPPNGSGSVDVVMLRGFEIPNQPAFQVLIAIPEPSTLVLLGIGVIGLLTYAWRWRKQTA
ncbi:MAG: PEP-CTERM sorting domain-containing protein, partial [Thermoguttaceae bacterium]